jgi:hypothetical protein
MTKRRLTFTLRKTYVIDITRYLITLLTMQTTSCGRLDAAPEATSRNYHGPR